MTVKIFDVFANLGVDQAIYEQLVVLAEGDPQRVCAHCMHRIRVQLIEVKEIKTPQQMAQNEF